METGAQLSNKLNGCLDNRFNVRDTLMLYWGYGHTQPPCWNKNGLPCWWSDQYPVLSYPVCGYSLCGFLICHRPWMGWHWFVLLICLHSMPWNVGKAGNTIAWDTVGLLAECKFNSRFPVPIKHGGEHWCFEKITGLHGGLNSGWKKKYMFSPIKMTSVWVALDTVVNDGMWFLRCTFHYSLIVIMHEGYGNRTQHVIRRTGSTNNNFNQQG